MEVRRITITIAGRNYPLNVPSAEEETLRKVGKQIEAMIKDFEQNFDVRDKQDALAMCALKLGTNAEAVSYTHLDVYKRQILLSFNITNNEKKFKNNFSIDDEKILEITVDNTEAILRILEPVSYTHLDVYKRQLQKSASKFDH